MKQPILFAALLSLFALTSCNTKDNMPKPGSYADRGAYVTAHITESVTENEEEEYYFVMDSGTSLFLEDNKYTGKLDFEDGERVLIHFYITEECDSDDIKSEGALYGCDFSIRLFDLFDVVVAESAFIYNDDDNDALPNHALTGAYSESSWMTGYGYINTIVRLQAKDFDDMKLYVAKNNAVRPDNMDKNYLYLDLRFDRGIADEDITATTDLKTDDFFISLPLADFESELEGKKGVKLRVRTKMSQSFTLTLNIEEDQRKISSYTSRAAGSML